MNLGVSIRHSKSLSSHGIQPPHDPLANVRSPYIPPTPEEINRHKKSGYRRSAPSQATDTLKPILEQESIPSSSSLEGTDSQENEETKKKDYSIRTNMVNERIRFEILLDKSTEEVDIRPKALVILGKLVNLDPSRKIMAYHDTDHTDYPMLNQSFDLPLPIEAMSKYVSAPMSRSRKLQFHTRFCTVTSLLEMKRNSGFMEWLKKNKVYTSVLTLNSTENTRVGFFIGKCPHITNIEAFSQWVHSRLSAHTPNCPDFQLNAEVIGGHKDQSTRTCAIVVTCPRSDVRELEISSTQNFTLVQTSPFLPSK